MSTTLFDTKEWALGRQLPEPTVLSQPFWDGLRQGQLLVQRCTACGQYVFRPETACTRCMSPGLEWTHSTGSGSVYSWSVVHRPPQPDMVVPFVLAVVELDEHWHMMTNLVGCDPDDVRVGLPVAVRIETVGDLGVPFFEPIREDDEDWR